MPNNVLQQNVLCQPARVIKLYLESAVLTHVRQVSSEVQILLNLLNFFRLHCSEFYVHELVANKQGLLPEEKQATNRR